MGADPVVCIVGPTASGKSALAQAVALALDGEVVSADSMQIYRGMDIGTGKLAPEERLVPHHGLDLADPGEPYSAALFQEYARACFRDIAARGKRAVLCGGTGLYVRAAIDAYEFPKGEQTGNPVREHYNRLANEQGSDVLWELLRERDPASAAIVPAADVKRVVRAFELLEEGTSLAEQRAKLADIPQLVPACFVGLSVEPAVLNARLDARVDGMFDAGLVDEVARLLQGGFRDGITAPQAIGYKEVVAALDGETTMEEAATRIKTATHRYAKRQRTWFRKDRRIRWIDANEPDVAAQAAEALDVLGDAACLSVSVTGWACGMIRFRRPALPKSLQDRSTYHADSTRVSLAVATAPDCLRTPPSVPVCLFLPRKVGSMSEFESVITRGMTPVSEERREKAVLVGVDRPGASWPLASSLAELERLVDTAGADVAAVTTQKLDAPNPRTFVGSGKAEEVAELARAHAADLVVFDDELTPSQQSNLEKVVGKDVKVIDRTALILDIFALHATSKEGRLQVRLAQNEYLLPRLRGMWAHLASNRMGGGVGSRFGEGESQLEVDRRMVRKRITSIRRELKHLAEVRAIQRESRYESGMFKVALAGYTNAGKSSLLNRLTNADVLAYDKLFATLDSTTRKFELPEGREITVTDTVGFIQKLPTTLIEAFKSTLDEITGADLVLHVVDASSDEYEAQIAAVEDVLGQIEAQDLLRVLVFNKCDLLDGEQCGALKARHPQAQFVSAATGEGIAELVGHVARVASAQDEHLDVVIPYNRGDLVSVAHERCHILSEKHEEDGTHLVMLAAPSFAGLFRPYAAEKDR